MTPLTHREGKIVPCPDFPPPSLKEMLPDFESKLLRRPVMVLLAQSSAVGFCTHPQQIKKKHNPITHLWTNTAELGNKVGQPRHKCPPCTQKEQMCFRLMPALVLHPPHSLSTFPKGWHQAHKVALALWCQRCNIRTYLHHGSMWSTVCHLYLSAQTFPISFTV